MTQPARSRASEAAAASYTSDADGRLTARPGQTMAWDHLGRLATVTTAAGTTTYTYDPLDRLATVQSPDGSRTRFRHTGLSTSAAQWIDDLTGAVIRSLASTPAGEHLADWDPAQGASSLRVYGTNAHHDVTWLADSTGSVISSLRYDPWGVPRSTPPSGYTPFRFQGSWTDTGTGLAWVVTRWYAPAMGTFLSEDSLLGDPQDPGSRHLHAYGQGEPVGRWDPEGRMQITNFVSWSHPHGQHNVAFVVKGCHRLMPWDDSECAYSRFRFEDGGWWLRVHSEGTNSASITERSWSEPQKLHETHKAWKLYVGAASLYLIGGFDGYPSPAYVATTSGIIWADVFTANSRTGPWRYRSGGIVFDRFAISYVYNTFDTRWLTQFNREQARWDGHPFVQDIGAPKLNAGDYVRVLLTLKVAVHTFSTASADVTLWVKGPWASLKSVAPRTYDGMY